MLPRPNILSAHAEHRHGDYFFARTQSRMMAEAPWENRLPPLSSWADYLLPAAGAVAAVSAALALGL